MHQSTAVSTWWCDPQPRLSWVEMAVGLPDGPSYPGLSPHTNHFFAMLPPERPCRRAARSFFKIDRLSSFARLYLLILLLMSSNVHSNPCSIFPCLVFAGNMIWQDRSVQCCTCSKWVHLKFSLLSFTKFKTLGSSHSWCCAPAASLLLQI